MNTLIKALALSLAVAMPAFAFAQSTSEPLTREQVQGELVQLHHAGYRESKSQYPRNIQAAEASVAAQGTVTGNAGTEFGGTAAGTSQSGHRISNDAWHPLYSRH